MKTLSPTLAILQCWLYATALQSSTRRFRIFNLVASAPTLEAAAKQLKKAKGRNTPGVDGVPFSALKQPAVMAKFLSKLQEAIKTGQYEPCPLRRSRVPKPDGRPRFLGIPTVVDRVVQHALLLLLTPAVEAELTPVTFACRPGLGPHHALRAVEAALERAPNDAYIIRGDIHAFFDRIPHAGLLELLRRRLQGQKLISLIWSQITAWGKYKHTGIPQGAPLSPLLANWFLSDVDRFFMARKTCAYTRYMDDIVIVIHGGRERAEQCLAELKKKLAAKGLRLSGRKTRVSSIQQGVEFLGLRVRRGKKNQVVFTVGAKSIASLRSKIADTTREKNNDKKKITAATAAWLAYFSQYAEEAGLEAVRYFEERTGIRGPRTSKGRKNGLVRKLPAWMEPAWLSPMEKPMGTQPPPGDVAQRRSSLGGHGEVDSSELQATRAALATLSERALRRHWGHCKWQVECLGEILSGIQQLIHEAREERALMRCHAASELQKMNAPEVSADAALQRCWLHRRLLTFEHEMSSEATEAQKELRSWKATLGEVSSLLDSRAGVDARWAA